MLSDAEIADQLDEILANPESDDEFIDEIDTGYDDDDFDIDILVPSSSPEPSSPVDAQPLSPFSFQSPKTVSPKVQHAKKTPLHTPDFKWKTNKNFHPKTFDFDYSKLVINHYSSIGHTHNHTHIDHITIHIPHHPDNKCGVQKHEFNLHDDSSILEFFEAFVSEFLPGKVAFETNRYAHQFLQHEVLSEHSRTKGWKDVDISELYVFIATTLLMSRNKKLDMKDNWSNDPLLHTPIFGKIMCRDRYLLILRIIHFCNNENQVNGYRLFKLDMVLDEVRANFKAAMVPFQNLVIDESLVFWKGRLSFKQIIKPKRHRFGIKFFVFRDVETDYILDFIIYTGAETRLLPYDINIGISGGVVKTLIAPYLNKGYNLYTDNWYTSLILSQYLLKKNNFDWNSKKNGRGMPPLKNKPSVGGVQSSHTKNMMVLKWLDRREVFMLSTLYDNKLADSGKVDRKGVMIKKPNCVVNYNACMGNIDKTDMLLSSVECVRKTLKWYKKIFFHLIDLCILNAFSTYKTVTGKFMSLANFQLELIRQLLEKFSSPTKSPNRGRPTSKDQPFRLTGRHFPSDVPTTNTGKANRRRCAVCIKNNKRTDTRYMCSDCDVGLCVTPCFGIYHTKKKFRI